MLSAGAGSQKINVHLMSEGTKGKPRVFSGYFGPLIQDGWKARDQCLRTDIALTVEK